MKMHAYIGGERRRELEKLTPRMWQMLFDIRNHGDDAYRAHDRKAQSRARRTRTSLQQRGLIVIARSSLYGYKWLLTEAGLVAVNVEWHKAPDTAEPEKLT